MHACLQVVSHLVGRGCICKWEMPLSPLWNLLLDWWRWGSSPGLPNLTSSPSFSLSCTQNLESGLKRSLQFFLEHFTCRRAELQGQGGDLPKVTQIWGMENGAALLLLVSYFILIHTGCLALCEFNTHHPSVFPSSKYFLGL